MRGAGKRAIAIVILIILVITLALIFVKGTTKKQEMEWDVHSGLIASGVGLKFVDAQTDCIFVTGHPNRRLNYEDRTRCMASKEKRMLPLRQKRALLLTPKGCQAEYQTKYQNDFTEAQIQRACEKAIDRMAQDQTSGEKVDN